VKHDDENLEEEGRSLSTLYRATRREAPSDAMDAALLALARRQAAARRRRWMLPLSSAAVVLLGVSLVLQMNLLGPPAYSPMPTASEETGKAFKKPLPEAATSAPAAAPAADGDIQLPREEKRRSAVKLQSVTPPRQATSMDEQQFDREDQNQPARAKAEAEGTISGLALPVWRSDAEHWLAAMLSLLQEGNVKAVQEELVLFRHRYPDHALPDELKRLESHSE
jgi:negative regulator of sigma E activity